MCGGSKSSSASTSSSSNTTVSTTSNVTSTADNRDFSDRRQIDLTDNSVDKRAVLKDATQILDSIYVNVDPSDEVLKSTVIAWQNAASDLMDARNFDTLAANELVTEIIGAAENGLVSINAAQLNQLRVWQEQSDATLDFAAASLSTGERLIQSAGQRQASISERILDLAAGAVGDTSSGQIKLIKTTLTGIALVLLAARFGGIKWKL